MFKDILTSDKRSLNAYNAYDDRLNILSSYNLNNEANSAPYQYHHHKPSHVDLHQYNDQIDDKRYSLLSYSHYKLLTLKKILDSGFQIK
jgi:hypothetical protein